MLNSKLKVLARVAFIAAFAMSSAFVTAQDASITVRGQVLDSTGQPVIGAAVVEEGTTNGVVTDVNGNYSIKVLSSANLKVSFIGYEEQTLPVNGQSDIDFRLLDEFTELEELVVVGYGVQKKSDVTGALTRVSAEELNVRPVNNAFEALQGRAAGVDITSNERPGELGSIRIRGERSLSASNSPLYVVDGVPLSAGGIETINPRDIEAIDILKDASSCAIYGSRGANGVVLVTTKRGKQGNMQLNYSGTITFEKLVDKAKPMSASDYITFRRWAKYFADPENNPRGDQPDMTKDKDYFTSDDPTSLENVMNGWSSGSWDPSKVIDTDWCGMVTQTGITHEHTLNASGGNEKIQAFGSFGYLNNEGTQKGQEFRRFNISGVVDIQAKEWFKMGVSFNSSYSLQKYGYSRTGQATSSGPQDIYSAAKAIIRYALPYDKQDNLINTPGGSTAGAYTVVDEWKKSTDNRETYRVLGNIYAQLDFSKIWEPLEGLSYKISFGPDFRYRRQGIFIKSISAVKMGGKNYASMSNERHFAWTLDNMITYNKNFDQNHIDLTLLQTASKNSTENMSESGNAIPNDNYLWYYMKSIDITDAKTYGAGMSTGLNEDQMTSYMARINYSLMDKYLLTISGRWDASSVLAEGNKWDFFPSAALGWRIDQEGFLTATWVDQLKLRIGYGSTGNAAVPSYGTLGNIQSFFVPFNDSNVQAYTTNEPYYTNNQVSMANPNLGWEKTTQTNIGFDYSFFTGRINGAIDFYHSNTEDIIMTMKLPTLTGFPNVKANVGETKNNGIEITLNAIPVKLSDFKWETSINFAYQKDKIVSLANGKVDDISNGWFIDESIAVHYGTDNDGLWKESDAAEMEKFNENGYKFSVGNVKPVDQNGDYKIDDKDRIILGRKNPTTTLGWNNTFTYKNFDLSIQMYGRFGYVANIGGQAMPGHQNQIDIDYWTPDNTGADWQKPIYTGTNGSSGDAYCSLLGFKDAAFLKLRNISLGYNLPYNICDKIGINNLKVYVQAKNLGNIFSSIDIIDLDLNTSYFNRGCTFGVQVGF